jgi:hypothetical protein
MWRTLLNQDQEQSRVLTNMGRILAVRRGSPMNQKYIVTWMGEILLRMKRNLES